MKVRAEQFAADLSKVDWSKLPASMKQDGEQLKAVAPFYAEGGDFKAGIDNYVAALNDKLAAAKRKVLSPPGVSKAKLKKATKAVKAVAEKTKRVVIYQDNVTTVFLLDPVTGAQKYDFAFESVEEAQQYIKDHNLIAVDGSVLLKKKKATGSKSGRHQSKAEAATAKEAYDTDKRKAEAGEFAKMSRNEVLEIAQRVHKNRRLAAQVVDEAVDHKKRLTPTPENLVRWMKEPGKYDLIGIDTFEKNNPTADLKIKKEIFWARLLKK
jgi:hypothetical protein